MNLQELILKKFKDIKDEFECEVVVNPEYANTGTIMFINSELKTILHFHYQFSNQRISLQFFPGNKEIVVCYGFTHEDCIRNDYIPYNESSKIIDVIKWVKGYLKRKLEND